MTSPERTGKELVPVDYATDAQPLAMFEPPKEMRHKKIARKRTADPDGTKISEVVKSSSPSPRTKVSNSTHKRKGTQQASSPSPRTKVSDSTHKRKGTLQASSPTPVKVNIIHHGKRPETKKVYEKKRKRANRGDEEFIDLNTPTKRVTRSSVLLKKVQKGKEREDKGIKRKTRHQVVKEDEEEEEWDEDEGDEEENVKEKKGHKRKGVKGKEGQPKQEKLEPKSAIQKRSTLKKGKICRVDCGVIVCIIMELLAHLEPIPKTLPKNEIDQFRADLVSRFLNDKGRSWTIKKWEARRMGKGSQ